MFFSYLFDKTTKYISLLKEKVQEREYLTVNVINSMWGVVTYIITREFVAFINLATLVMYEA